MEACNLLTLAGETFQDDFIPIAEKFMTKESLLKLINCATKLMADAGHKCVISLLENSQSSKFIPKICEELNSKNSLLRVKCSTYLINILNSYQKSSYEKFLPLIENSILIIVKDANGDVRNKGKKLYSIFKENFPLKAEKLFNKFDDTIQKYIYEDNYEENNLSPVKNSQERNNFFSKNSPNSPNLYIDNKRMKNKNESLLSPEIKKKTNSNKKVNKSSSSLCQKEFDDLLESKENLLENKRQEIENNIQSNSNKKKKENKIISCKNIGTNEDEFQFKGKII